MKLQKTAIKQVFALNWASKMLMPVYVSSKPSWPVVAWHFTNKQSDMQVLNNVWQALNQQIQKHGNKLSSNRFQWSIVGI